jgi:hypothetical protein
MGTDTERYSNESDRGDGPGRRNGRDEAGRAARAAGGEARQPLGREPGRGSRRADLRRVGGASAGRRHGGYRPAVRVLLRTGHLVPPDGAYADKVRRQEFPIIGAGSGVWSWVHVEDAALATVEITWRGKTVYTSVWQKPVQLRTNSRGAPTASRSRKS